MRKDELISHKRNVFSQNGEDGVIESIFAIIGAESRKCCEFGAWDGRHFSNSRQLILAGWKGLLIEKDGDRFSELQRNYKNNKKVVCVQKQVGARGETISKLGRLNGFTDLDFLSVDIDGLDYEIFETLTVRPRVICIEVNAGHDPRSQIVIDRETASGNVGQSLTVMSEIARKKNYSLVCYTGNAFFLRNDVIQEFLVPILFPEEAYQQFLEHLTMLERDWYFLVGQGLEPANYKFINPYLTRRTLRLSFTRAIKLLLEKDGGGWPALPRFLVKEALGK